MSSIKHKGWKWSTRDASNPTLVMVLDNTSKTVHVTDASDQDTDWALSAASHPTVCIHSATNPATEYIKMYHDATNAYIDGVGATAMKLLIGGTSELDLTAAALAPSTSDGNALGTTSLMWSDLFLASGGVINFNNGDVTITHGSNVLTVAGGLLASTNTTGFSSTATFVPDATRTNYALAIGSRVTELDVTMAASASQNFDPIQINLNVIGSAPTSTSTLNGIYQQITHDTTAMANIRVKGGDWTVTIGANATDAYVYQGELQHTANATLSGESICMSALTSLSAGVAVTADRVCALQAMILGSGAAATITGDVFVAYVVNAGTCVTTDSIVNVRNQSAATATSAMEMELDGTVTYAIDFQGTVSDGWTTADGAVTQSNEYVLIPVRVAGVTPTLYLIAGETWS